jgi:hypothetical protein
VRGARRHLVAVALVVAWTPLAGDAARAQAVTGIGDEAVTLPAGVVRLSGAFANERYDSRYGTGGLQPLGSDLSVDSLGATQLPVLAPLQNALRALTEIPTLGISLSSPQITSSARVSVAPLNLDIGVTHRITLRAIVPIVHTHNEILFNPNPGGATGNVGLNPALRITAALAADTALYASFAAASTNLANDLAACQRNPGSASYCASLNAQAGAATALITQSNTFAGQLSQVYGGNGRAPSPIVPVDSSGLWLAVTHRIQGFATQFAHFDSLTGGPGVANLAPVGAPPLALGDAQNLITTNTLGLSYDTLQSVDRTGLGDIEVGATALILDSFHGSDTARMHPRGFNYRLALTGMFRLGTGSPSSPDALTEIGTGTGANAVELHVATDFLIGRHVWASLIARGTQPLYDNVQVRIPLQLGNEYIPSWAKQTVGRQLGRLLDFELDPHYAFNDYVAVVGQYRYLNKRADTYSGTFSLDSATTGFGPVTLNANVLNTGTETTEQRWGLGITFSTVAGAARHPSRLPFEATFFHYQTLTGSAGAYGRLPRVDVDVIQLRLYVRLFGHGGAFKR